MEERDELRTRWFQWYLGLNPQHIEEQFKRYTVLTQRVQYLTKMAQRYSSHSFLNLATVKENIERAADQLHFDKPYRIMVLGQSGAGKSTFINALIGTDLLRMATGSATTGTVTSVMIEEDNQPNTANVYYRSDEGFITLIQGFGKRYGFTAPSDPSVLLDDLKDQKIQKQFRSDMSTLDREAIPNDLKDIAQTWIRLRNHNLLGGHQSYNLDESEKEILELIDEESERNRLTDGHSNSKRIVPGIERVEFRVNTSVMNSHQSMRNVALVDTPGWGASIRRHHQILLQEVTYADAIILLVNAVRPADAAAEMAYLLQKVLLEEFSIEDQRRFANKVFLVANRYDEVLGDPDRPQDSESRLTNELKRISTIISDNYWERHCLQNGPDGRYFKTMARLSVLVNKQKRQPLNAQELVAYNRYLPVLQGSDGQPETIDEQTQIPMVRQSLERFLAEQRLKLLLDTADSRLRMAQGEMVKAAEAILRNHNIKKDSGISALLAHSVYRRKKCEEQLIKIHFSLRENVKELLASMGEWRRSEEYEAKLVEEVSKIYDILETEVQTELNRWLLISDHAQPRDETVIDEIIDDISRIKITEGRPRALVIYIERRLREVLEESSRRVAGFYTSKFDNLLEGMGISARLMDKTYGQDYVLSYNPDLRLKQFIEQLHKEFEESCRWLLLYELIKRPILIQSSAPMDISYIWNVVKKVAGELVEDGVELLLAYAGMGHLARIGGKVATVILREAQLDRPASSPGPTPRSKDFIHQIRRQDTSSPKVTSQPSPTEESTNEIQTNIPGWTPRAPLPANAVLVPDFKLPITLEDETSLVSHINEYLNEHKFEQIKTLLQEQFALRYHSAFGAALPLLEGLFFYELSRFERAYYTLVKEIIEVHKAHVLVYPNGSVAELLLREAAADLTQVDCVAQLLSDLEQVPR